jgi:ligand-binding sensor domain-containing protein
MRFPKMRSSVFCRVFALGALAACYCIQSAQLPLRRYSTADGLASNTILGIAPDSRGFLWFATVEGLSRFDGFGFANQTESTGLPRTLIRQILIGRHGNYWLATPDGLIRFRPDLPQSSTERVVVIRPNNKPAPTGILTLLEDRNGKLWCGTSAGLYAIDVTAGRMPRLTEVPIGLPGVSWGDSEVDALAEDAEGGLWIGTTDGMLYRRTADRRIERYTTTEIAPQGQITRLLTDRKGRIWVGRGNSLYRSKPAPHPGANGFERVSGQNGGPPMARVFDIFESNDGDVWVAMYRCLAQFPADGGPVRVWNKDNGLPSRGIGALAQDRNGNLWLGTGDQGAFKLAAGGVLTYSINDGIGVDGVISIAETIRGDLYISGRLESDGFRIATRSGDAFRAIAPRVPKSVFRKSHRILGISTQRRGEFTSTGPLRRNLPQRPVSGLVRTPI